MKRTLPIFAVLLVLLAAIALANPSSWNPPGSWRSSSGPRRW